MGRGWRKRRAKIRLLGLVLALFLVGVVAIACQPPPPTQLETTTSQVEVLDPEPDVNLVLIQHGACPWAYFWCVVETGIKDAAKNLNVNATILRPSNFNLDKVKEMLETAVEAEPKPDGIGITLSDRDRFKPALIRAAERNIPVIAYNSGFGSNRNEIPYKTYIGADEYTGGYQSGLRLVEAGGKRGVCINHQPGHEGLDARCQGFLDAMRRYGISAATLKVTVNPAESKQQIQEFYQRNPKIDTFLTLGPEVAAPFYKVIQDVGLKKDTFFHGTFDLSNTILQKIKSGTTLFAVDQQPYLEGYMTVQWLTWIHRHGFSPPEDEILTGPSFVTIENVDLVMAQVSKYR